MKGLAGKSVFVSGGGSGIGRAAALRVAEEGARVTIGDWNADGAAETAAMIEKAGGGAQSIRMDVSQESQVAAAVELALATYGRLDGACNAAGIPSKQKPVHELKMEEWCHSVDVNLTGAFLITKYAVGAMLHSGNGGSIVHISSTAAIRGFMINSEYCATKAGILGLVRGAAHDYGKLGIRINAILPGPVVTPLLTGSLDGMPAIRDRLLSDVPMGRFAAPSELGEAIAWLLSESASFVTGASFPVDGGHSVG